MFQRVIVAGRLGNDPELRYTPGGTQVCTFDVAANRRWTDRDGNRQERTTWFRVSTWGKLAGICHQYLHKGRAVLIEGEVDASAWIDQEGNARATLELRAVNVRFLDGGNTSNEDSIAEPESIAQDEDIPF